MTPTWEREGVQLYLADCREVLPHLSRVDAVVTDPPYGISDGPQRREVANGKRVGNRNTWFDDSQWDESLDERLCEVSQLADVVAWFGHWRKREQVANAINLPLRAEIVWAKDCHVGPPCPAAMRDERIWLFSSRAIKTTRFETTVWDEPIIPTWEHRHHRNEKPLGLMTRLVSWLDCEKVLDHCMGSGSTIIACIRTGRHAIGIESDPVHFATARERIEREMDSQPLIAELEAKERQLEFVA